MTPQAAALTSIPPGIPSIADYLRATRSPLFSETEEFSNSFLRAHKRALAMVKPILLLRQPRKQSRNFTFFCCTLRKPPAGASPARSGAAASTAS